MTEATQNYINIEGARCNSEDFIIDEVQLKRLEDDELNDFIAYLTTEVV